MCKLSTYSRKHRLLPSIPSPEVQKQRSTEQPVSQDGKSDWSGAPGTGGALSRVCSKAKGVRKPVKPFTYTRATKPAERGFVDLSGPKFVMSMGGKKYMMIVRDDFSRSTRVFFLRIKDEAATYFSKYLAEIAPCKVEVVRSDGGGEFSKGAFGAPCTTEKTGKNSRQPITYKTTVLLNAKSQS